MIKNIFVLIVFMVVGCLKQSVVAQDNVNQEVKVIKAYIPVINDAFKITELPKISDTNKVITEFDYEIIPARHKTGFEPIVIKPARLISEPLSKLYYGQAKVGFGSYLSPLAQVYIGSKRSEQLNWNVMLHHNSSHGKIKNEVSEKVYAGLSKSSANAEVNYFTKNSKIFSVSTELSNKTNYYYGYNPSVINDNLTAPLVKDSIEKQSIYYFSVFGNWRTNYLDSSKANYDLNLGFQNLNGMDGIGESALKIKANIDYFFEKEFIGVDLDLNYYTNIGIDSVLDGAIIKFSPWVGAFGNKWRIVAGVTTYYDQPNQKYLFAPRVSMHYNIIDYFLIPYFELDGNYNENSYKDIYNKNPFILQSLGVKPTETKINATFGFRGNISSKIAFNTKINYAKINNQYFFVNDTSDLVPLQNKFNVVYDDITRIRFLAEVSYNAGEKLFLNLKGNYYHYNLSTESQPWHMPNYSVSINARYIIQKKITLSTNIFAIGKRYARNFDDNMIQYDKTLQGIVDLNLGVDYRMSKVFSAFAYFNNISSVKYYEWNHYPSQQFNVMLGVTYSF